MTSDLNDCSSTVIDHLRIKKQAGFTYMGLLIVIAIAGIGMAGVGIVWHQESQREREKELLFIGAEYRKAIGSYYENSPSGAKQYPQSLQELVLDKRFPAIKRHIRQLYADPFNKTLFTKESKAWNLVLEQGQIKGVYSSAELEPIKKFGFAITEESFSEATKYSDWRFVYTPGSLASSAPPMPDINQPETEQNSLPPSINAPSNPEQPAPPNTPLDTLPPSINAQDNALNNGLNNPATQESN